MSQHKTKYIFVTGGVVSSLGKGITSASLGAILQARGLDIGVLKLDPYLNVDPGTMNPFQHGEVFVTDDGAETDLDLGHYERYLSCKLSKLNSRSAGQIYTQVLERERAGDYLGATIQVIPHITDAIKAAIHEAAKGHDLLICEVGGTVGDIESLPFIEAIRQMRQDHGEENVLFAHVSYVPRIRSAGELKTKPTQHSVKELLGIGVQPDVLILRSDEGVPQEIKGKIASFCNVPVKAVINCPDVSTVYEVPLMLAKENLDEVVIEKLNIWARKADLHRWKKLVERYQNPHHHVNIAVVGKYVELVESYKSINEALIHAGIAQQTKIHFSYIDSESIEQTGPAKTFESMDGILVPGGFGQRGTLGKILTVQYAREHQIPFFGICLGLQIAVIEFARNVAGITDATSQEFDPKAQNPVIHIMESQKQVSRKGASMRLGSYPCQLIPGTLAHQVYGKHLIDERHRHRFEVNNAYREQLHAAGLVFSGLSPDETLVEIVEIPTHPHFIACQFHPEFLSHPLEPHPLFTAFVKAAIKRQEQKTSHPDS